MAQRHLTPPYPDDAGQPFIPRSLAIHHFPPYPVTSGREFIPKTWEQQHFPAYPTKRELPEYEDLFVGQDTIVGPNTII